jgi:hypothetical protein
MRELYYVYSTELGTKITDPKSFKNGASQGSVGYNQEKILILP